MSSSVGARRVTVPSVRVGMVPRGSGMRSIVVAAPNPWRGHSAQPRAPAGTMAAMSQQTPSGGQARPRVLSGIQPTSDSFHFGNYLGATRQWVDLQEAPQPFFFIADMHALEPGPEPKQLRQRTLASAAQLIAMGIDPDRSAIFVQSQMPDHAEPIWVLQCLTGFGGARRMTP